MLLGRHANVVARTKLGLSSDWAIYAFERIDDTDAIKVMLGIPTKTEGGGVIWSEKEKTAVITELEMSVELDKYEGETGKCGLCLDEKVVFSRWSQNDGVTTKPCPRCYKEAN